MHVFNKADTMKYQMAVYLTKGFSKRIRFNSSYCFWQPSVKSTLIYHLYICTQELVKKMLICPVCPAIKPTAIGIPYMHLVTSVNFHSLRT